MKHLLANNSRNPRDLSKSKFPIFSKLNVLNFQRIIIYSITEYANPITIFIIKFSNDFLKPTSTLSIFWMDCCVHTGWDFQQAWKIRRPKIDISKRRISGFAYQSWFAHPFLRPRSLVRTEGNRRLSWTEPRLDSSWKAHSEHSYFRWARGMN